MKENLSFILLLSLTVAQGKYDVELPICPTNIQLFPQQLPMHCRLAKPSEKMPNTPTIMPPLPPGFQSPSRDGQPAPIPVPFPGGLPMPGPMPGGMQGPLPMMPPMPPGMPMAMPGLMPGGMPGPMPVPMPPMVSMGGPNHKLPVIVMPFYSPDNNYKKKSNEKPRIYKKRRRHPKYRDSSTDTDTDTEDCSDDTSDTDTDSSSDTSSDRETWKSWKKGWGKHARKFNTRRSSRKQKKKKKELLTPVLQYVTKDGYVIFEKQISKGEASDWLKTDDYRRENKNNEGKKNNHNNQIIEVDVVDDNEDNKKYVSTAGTTVTNRPKRHRQYHHEGVKLNYKQI